VYVYEHWKTLGENSTFITCLLFVMHVGGKSHWLFSFTYILVYLHGLVFCCRHERSCVLLLLQCLGFYKHCCIQHDCIADGCITSTCRTVWPWYRSTSKDKSWLLRHSCCWTENVKGLLYSLVLISLFICVWMAMSKELLVPEWLQVET